VRDDEGDLDLVVADLEADEVEAAWHNRDGTPWISTS
jgi:hypothetical protein